MSAQSSGKVAASCQPSLTFPIDGMVMVSFGRSTKRARQEAAGASTSPSDETRGSAERYDLKHKNTMVCILIDEV